MNRYQHDPVDLALADQVYTQMLAITLDENAARERVYRHLTSILRWEDDRAQHASSLAMEINEAI